jgi:hypothetical protein
MPNSRVFINLLQNTKMKNILLLILLVTSTVTTYSQTKQETEKWLLGKLTACTQTGLRYVSIKSEVEDHSYIIMYAENKFSISQGNLVISFKELFPKKNKYAKPNDLIKFDTIKVSYSIPIGSCKSFEEYRDGSSMLKLTCDSKSIKRWFNGKLQDGKSYDAEFGFDLKCDTDLLDRLNKALLHLKSFYPIVKSPEPF